MKGQVTDRIEKKLQETPQIDCVKRYTVQGRSVAFVTLQQSTPKKRPALLQAQSICPQSNALETRLVRGSV